MVAICGGGSSAPNTGLDLALTYSSGRLAQLLVSAGLSELSAWLPLVGLIPVVLSAFCGADPPTMVALTRAESDALANNTFGADFFNGLGKFKDVLLNLIWLDACHCTSGALAAPTPPAINANTPVFVAPTGQVVQPCATLLSGPVVSAGGAYTAVAGPIAIPGNVTSCFVSATGVTGAAPGADAIVQLNTTNTYSAGLGSISNNFQLVNGTTPAVRTVSNPIGGRFAWWGLRDSTAGTIHASLRADFYCGNQLPGDIQQPCGPPDPATQASLDLLMQMVTLIQRQSVPFGYVASTAHAGLSGAGALSISGLLGVKIAITTLPSSYGTRGTSPPEHFDLGYVTFGVADGFPSSYRVDKNPQVIFPPRCSVYTDLDYDLAPGITVTITELLREP